MIVWIKTNDRLVVSMCAANQCCAGSGYECCNRSWTGAKYEYTFWADAKGMKSGGWSHWHTSVGAVMVGYGFE